MNNNNNNQRLGTALMVVNSATTQADVEDLRATAYRVLDAAKCQGHTDLALDTLKGIGDARYLASMVNAAYGEVTS